MNVGKDIMFIFIVGFIVLGEIRIIVIVFVFCVCFIIYVWIGMVWGFNIFIRNFWYFCNII